MASPRSWARTADVAPAAVITTSAIRSVLILMGPRLVRCDKRAVEAVRQAGLPDRYFWIDQHCPKIEYGRYRWQNLPALPASGCRPHRSCGWSGLIAHPCYQFVSADRPVLIEPKDWPLTTKPLLAIMRPAGVIARPAETIGTNFREITSKPMARPLARDQGAHLLSIGKTSRGILPIMKW